MVPLNVGTGSSGSFITIGPEIADDPQLMGVKAGDGRSLSMR